MSVITIITHPPFSHLHASSSIRRAITYYFTTTISAVVLGIILVTTIRPGATDDFDKEVTKSAVTRVVLTQDTLLDLIR